MKACQKKGRDSMEELKYSFKHQIEKSGLENHHLETSLPDNDVERVKKLRGFSKIKNIFKSQKLKNLFLLQEVFKQK